tara:strand:+ start:529 stop:792 length:264 start_codon:yes stop_codon:yes gene_type:complete
MNKLPIEIENKIWTFYYSNIYYTNVILELNKRITICNKIVANEIRGFSTELCLLKFYNNELSKIYEKDELKRRLFMISFYIFGMNTF